VDYIDLTSDRTDHTDEVFLLGSHATSLLC
jgi:hypothetical protein